MLRTSVVFTSSESDIALNYNTIHCTEQFSLEMGVKLIYQTESLAFAFTSGICGHTVWVTLLLGLKPRRRQETPFSHTQADSQTCNCTRPCETPFSPVLAQSNATLQGTPFSIISNLRYTTLPGTPFQWRIQDFPKVGAPTAQGGCQHTILPNVSKNCMKLKEFGPRGDPLRFANTFSPVSTLSYASRCVR